jgi:NAD(P)-dependent dehydrogenase (short-subunit alcohol dehydrogenase family)
MGILTDKVAVITGGTRGIGLAIARAYTREGAVVVLASRAQSAVDTAVQQITSAGGRAAGLAVDVADLQQVQGLAALALEQFGRLDVWVNNAGIAGPYGPTLDVDPAEFTRLVQTNILGTYYGSRTAMQHFTAQRSGKLINLLGRGHKGPLPWQNAYGSSKAWVRAFTRALAEETKDSGAGVFAFSPGMVLTDLLTDVEVIAGSEHRLNAFPTVVRMLARPAEIPARKAVWIASSATDGKTGLEISLSTPGSMLGQVLREGLRTARKRPTPVSINVRTIPPYRD